LVGVVVAASLGEQQDEEQEMAQRELVHGRWCLAMEGTQAGSLHIKVCATV